MNSILRYRLSKLRKLYRDESIPWDITKDFPAAESLLVEMILGKTFPVIEIAMDFPWKERSGNMYRKISELITLSSIDITLFSRDELEHLVLIASYKLARRFIARGHIGNIYKFMASELPQYYIRELMMDTGNDREYAGNIEEAEAPLSQGLPGSPEDYMKMIKDIGVGAYVDNYSFYNRTHFYRILKKKTTEVEDS